MASKQDRVKKTLNNKLFRRGQESGIIFMLHVIAWVLVEGKYFEDKQVQKILDEMAEFADDLGTGMIRYNDIKEVLKDEHNITISFGSKTGD